MTDRIVLHHMEFEGFHGVDDEERSLPQVIEVDVELEVDLRTAGATDDLEQTVNYSQVFKRCRTIVEEQSFHLLEAMAHTIASDLIATFAPIKSLVVRVRKPGVPIEGVLDFAGVEIERSR
ncbi:MAG TPA: dihydroneopterin aldolase [Candidatus Limnocylindrales bacterium]|nr:dihydroneopterin aldolase [Candidatus Limnocylindrales bacterium]